MMMVRRRHGRLRGIVRAVGTQRCMWVFLGPSRQRASGTERYDERGHDDTVITEKLLKSATKVMSICLGAGKGRHARGISSFASHQRSSERRLCMNNVQTAAHLARVDETDGSLTTTQA